MSRLSRKDPKGHTRREIHSILMLASDAGFVATAISGSNAEHSLAEARCASARSGFDF